MDQDQEFKRAKRLLAAGVVFLFSTYLSCDELRYKIRGKPAEARVVKVEPGMEIGRRGRGRPMLAVEYTFQDEAQRSITARSLVPVDTQFPADGKIPIQYIPNVEDSPRLPVQANTFAVVLFFGSLAVTALFLFQLAREANAPPARGRVR